MTMVPFSCINPFFEFQVIDNGEGFNSINYNSFLEAYSNLKVSKGCKGIGRFLWLKAFTKVSIESIYYEKDKWLKRQFEFSADNGVEPEENIKNLLILQLIGWNLQLFQKEAIGPYTQAI